MHYYFDGNFTELASIIDAQSPYENVTYDAVPLEEEQKEEIIHFHRHGYCYKAIGYYINEDIHYLLRRKPANEI